MSWKWAKIGGLGFLAVVFLFFLMRPEGGWKELEAKEEFGEWEVGDAEINKFGEMHVSARSPRSPIASISNPENHIGLISLKFQCKGGMDWFVPPDLSPSALDSKDGIKNMTTAIISMPLTLEFTDFMEDSAVTPFYFKKITVMWGQDFGGKPQHTDTAELAGLRLKTNEANPYHSNIAAIVKPPLVVLRDRIDESKAMGVTLPWMRGITPIRLNGASQSIREAIRKCKDWKE